MAVVLESGDPRLPVLLRGLRRLGVPVRVEYHGGLAVVGYEARAVWKRCGYELGLGGRRYHECVSAWRARLEELASTVASGLGLEPPLECPLCGALFATARDAGRHLQAHLDGFLDGRRGSGARAAGRRGPRGVAARPRMGGGLQ